MSINEHQDPKAYHPRFHWKYVGPQYWGTWIGIALGIFFSILPHFIHKMIAFTLARLIIHIKSGGIRRAKINLLLCFPEKSAQEHRKVLVDHFTVAICYLLKVSSLTIRSRKWLHKHVIVTGMEHLLNQPSPKNTILLVPHTWPIDIPGVYLASMGHPIVGFAKQQRNPLSDWLMHRQRVQYGGKIITRDKGIKSLIKAIKEGYWAYYLPDEDYGEKNSVFVDFFATTKATLSGLDKLAQLAQARIIPIFSSLNLKNGKFEINFFPEIKLSGDSVQDARMMNMFIEQVISQQPEQYMWILKLLKTQKPGIIEPYISNEYPF
jgi:lauroyl-KDO2-lipid IV(A) myristoyltransferase